MSLLAKEDVYPSRVGDQPAILERRDPTVYGHQAGPLSTVQLNDYQDNGFLLWENLFSAAEVAKMRDDLRRVRRRKERPVIIRTLEDVGGTEREVNAPTWSSRRMILAEHEVGVGGIEVEGFRVPNELPDLRPVAYGQPT